MQRPRYGETGETRINARNVARLGMWVPLNFFWDKILRIANERHESKRREVWYRHWGDNNPHLVGLMGELTFALAVPCKINSKLIHRGGDGYHDFSFYFAESDYRHTVDVKTTTSISPIYSPEIMVCKEIADKHPSDYYVLAQADVENMRCRLVASIHKGYLIKPENVKNFGYSDNYVLPANNMHDVKSLLEWFDGCDTKGN